MRHRDRETKRKKDINKERHQDRETQRKRDTEKGRHRESGRKRESLGKICNFRNGKILK